MDNNNNINEKEIEKKSSNKEEEYSDDDDKKKRKEKKNKKKIKKENKKKNKKDKLKKNEIRYSELLNKSDSDDSLNTKTKRSAISGEKISLKLKISKEEKIQNKRRKEYLEWLNEGF